MLQIEITEGTDFDESTQKFIERPALSLSLEHSLVSLSKWESIFEKPFMGDEERTPEEVLAYVRAMVIEPQRLPPDPLRLSPELLTEIQNYMASSQTATIVPQRPSSGRGETVTSELIYFWMTSYQIPWEAENWHLNRLLTLIRVFNVKNSKPSKADHHAAAQSRAELNAQRRAQSGSTG